MKKADVLVVSSYGFSTFAASSSFRLKIRDEIATIQRIEAIVKGIPYDEGQHRANWHSAPKLNGIAIYDYLASKGYDCQIVDTFQEEVDRAEAILRNRPRFCIISTTFIMSKNELKALAQHIKQLAPDTIIVAGGPFVLSSFALYTRLTDPGYDTTSPENDYLFLNNKNIPQIDYYVVSSQGLNTLAELMEALSREKPVQDIPNIGYYDKGNIRFTQMRKEDCIKDQCIKWDGLHKRFIDQKVITVQASNGCPFRCRFCNFVKDPRFTFVRPIEDIVWDLKQLENLGIEYVRFVDDNFRLGKKDVTEFCKRLVDENLGIKWMSFFRISNLENVDHGLLKKSGCMEVQLGLESADQEVLNHMGKKVNPKIFSPIIKSLLKQGIDVFSTFIFGFPGETEASARHTIDFIKSIDCTHTEGNFSWVIFPFILAPLSPIYEASQREKFGLKGYMHQWRHSSMDIKSSQELIAEAYTQIENVGAGFTGDSLKMLDRLSPEKRKQFFETRHRVSKLAQTRDLTDEEIVDSFARFF